MSEKSTLLVRQSGIRGREKPIKEQAHDYGGNEENINYSIEERHLLFFVINEKGNIISIQDVLAEYLGYVSEDLVGKSFEILIKNNDLKIDELDNGDSRISKRLIVKRRDGSRFLAVCILFHLFDRNNRRISLLVIESILDLINN